MSEIFTNDIFLKDEPFISHYGTKRHSGRFPWGSGDNPYQHEAFRNWISDRRSSGASEKDIVDELDARGFRLWVEEQKESGRTEKEIAKSIDISTTRLRQRISNARAEVRAEDRARAMRLKEHGYSNVKIAEKMGLPGESSVRSLLNEESARRTDSTRETADILKTYVDKGRYIDIGKGNNIDLNCTENRFSNAVALLEEEGYKKQYVKVMQLGTGHETTVKVLTPPDVDYKELYEHRFDIKPISSVDQIVDINGNKKADTKKKFESVSSDRVQIVYNEEGGINKDGLIELRRGVDDISLGAAQYAQVRIAVDGTHYLKGMAIYADDLPKGVDIRFNTNKHVGTPMLGEKDNSVLKKIKDDPTNPFGATIKESEDLKLVKREYIGKDGKVHQSAINVVNEEGEWGEWSKTLSAQFLSKQDPALAKRQLDLAMAERKDQLDDIMSYTNPTVKRKLLKSFADECDAAAVNLKAAALPRQASHVILPFTDISEKEIYAPNYKNGEKVVLIRYPHAGTFEIPTLTVNNNSKTAKKLIFNAPDAVGINAKVAERLSGADFDGDTVLVIPVNDRVKVRTREPLKDLVGFDPKEVYKGYEGMKPLTEEAKQTQMGIVSNLITDMTLKGANDDELARAVRHSMTVIDAPKHNLDYKRSEIENGIEALKRRYQAKEDGRYGGASTLISAAKSETRVPERKDGYRINKETGEKEWIETGGTYSLPKTYKRTGETVWQTHQRLQKSTKMAETNDAYTLTSGGSKKTPGTRMEAIYAEYANECKRIANEARKEVAKNEKLKYEPTAAKTYAKEVEDLNRKLNDALRNAPKERQAQLIANRIYLEKLQNTEGGLDKEHKKKEKGRALIAARVMVGASKPKIDITESEWKAIQAGAIHDSKLMSILTNADEDQVKKYASSRTTTSLTNSQINRIKSMYNVGHTTAEIAEMLGVSTSTVSKVMNS